MTKTLAGSDDTLTPREGRRMTHTQAKGLLAFTHLQIYPTTTAPLPSPHDDGLTNSARMARFGYSRYPYLGF